MEYIVKVEYIVKNKLLQNTAPDTHGAQKRLNTKTIVLCTKEMNNVRSCNAEELRDPD